MIGYLATNEPTSVLIERLQADGRTPYVIPPAESKAALLESFARVLHFPSYFGNNLDALEECLRELPSLRRPAAIVWEAASAFRAADPRTYTSVVRILATSLPDGVDALICLQ